MEAPPSSKPAGRLRVTPAVAHVLPLAVFLCLTALVSLVAIENSMMPWWRQAPEQWVYPLQTVVAGVLLWLWRRHYVLAPYRGFGLAAVLGVVGIVWWCLPGFIWQRMQAAGLEVPAWADWLGLVERREGFDPTLFQEHPEWQAAAIFMRFLRLVIVVPLVEEIFWRGFLMRVVQADGDDFRRVPFGRHSWAAYLVTTGAFMVAHDTSDWLGALGFGSLMYLVAVRTRSLAACIFMHAVANLLLGLYVMATGQWGYW